MSPHYTDCYTYIVQLYGLSIVLDCHDGEVRLVRGRNTLQGRVEVCFDGVWGTVCSHGWSVEDTNVVCRQLGFSGSGMTEYSISLSVYNSINSLIINFIGSTPSYNGRFGRGSGPVFYADVMCGGLEARLLDCDKGVLEETNCNHNQDAGVICLPGELVIL